MRKLNEQNVRKLTRLGGHSLGLTIPIEITRALGWKVRSEYLELRKTFSELLRI